MRYCYSVTEVQVPLIPELNLDQAGLEIRLDSYTDDPDFHALRAGTDAPLVATYRSRPHLGLADAETREPLGWIWRLAALSAGFQWVDLELDESDLADKIKAVHQAGGKVILSHHQLDDNPEALEQAWLRAQQTDADLIKIIGAGSRTADFAAQRRRYESTERPLIHFFMGADYVASRVLSLIYGAPFTFLATTDGNAVAPGQVTRETMDSIYRPLDVRLNALKLFAVIGSPIGHSKSPAYHNGSLKERDGDALFLPLPAATKDDLNLIKTFFPELRGMAVTKPMKEIAYQQTDRFSDPYSDGLGAVNTLLFRKRGLEAANTDLMAMAELLRETQCEGVVRVLGYGGLGRAVVKACIALGLPVEVVNRSPEKLRDLPDGVVTLDWESRACEGAEVLVQCTSAGMAPDVDVCPMPRLPKSLKVLIETIYNPKETRLMGMAKVDDVQILDGMALFNRQAEIQNKYFCDALIS